jgi:hypothetical protein
MEKGLIAKRNFMQAMAYRRTGMTISATVPKDFEIEQAKPFIVVMADKNTENEIRDDLGYGSQGKDIMDEGLTPMHTTRKGADEEGATQKEQ